MLRERFFGILIILLCASFSISLANIIYVDINGTGDYTTIQEGINASVDGDTIIVYPGTYFENINYNGKNIIVASLYLTTQNNSYIDSTIIDGNQNGSVVKFESGENHAILCGFTIQNGSGTFHLHNIRGGGIFCMSANPKISNCMIKNNNAEQGGGIFYTNSNVNLSNVTITKNYAVYNGGGIFFENVSNIDFDAQKRCNIFLNYSGIGCDVRAFNCSIIDVIVDTFTVMEPDDFFVYPLDNFTFDILHSKIEPVNQDLYVSPEGDNNNSGLTPSEPLQTISYALTKIASDSTHPNTIHLANGIYSSSLTNEIFPLNCRRYVSIIGEVEDLTILDGDNTYPVIICAFNDSYFSIENLTIQNGNASVGAGIFFETNSNPIIKNMTIKNNTAMLGGGILCSESNPTFENVTVSNNYAEATGGGIKLSNSSPILKNVIVSENSVNPAWGSSAGINCSNSNPILTNVAIVNNTSGEDGSILGNGHDSCPTLNNIITAGNNIPDKVIYCTRDNNLLINNCILYNTNSNSEISFYPNGWSNVVTISYTDIKDGEDGIQTNGAG
ncbi:MAG: hypothetical protein DRH57_08180, partial [Candidatus Cloacimonadota bacterium]